MFKKGFKKAVSIFVIGFMLMITATPAVVNAQEAGDIEAATITEASNIANEGNDELTNEKESGNLQEETNNESADDSGNLEGETNSKSVDDSSNSEGGTNNESADDSSNPVGDTNDENVDGNGNPEGDTNDENVDGNGNPEGDTISENIDDSSNPEGDTNSENTDESNNPEGDTISENIDDSSNPEGDTNSENTDESNNPEGDTNSENTGDSTYSEGDNDISDENKDDNNIGNEEENNDPATSGKENAENDANKMPENELQMIDGGADIKGIFDSDYYVDLGVSPGGAGYITPDPEESYEEGVEATFTAHANEGYVFDHWDYTFVPGFSSYYSENGANLTITMDGLVNKKEATAVFEKLYEADLDVWPEGAGYIEGGTEKYYSEGSKATFIAHANEGYVFKKWIYIGSCYDDDVGNLTITMKGSNKEKKATAVFEKLYEADLDVWPEGAGYIEGGTEKYYSEGSKATFKAQANPGYVFKYWDDFGISGIYYEISGANNEILTITMEGPKKEKEATAYFEKTHKLTVEKIGEGHIEELKNMCEDNGKVVSGECEYETGKLVWLKAIPDPNWEIEKWNIKSENTEFTLTRSSLKADIEEYLNIEITDIMLDYILNKGKMPVIMDKPKTVTITFKQTKCELTTNIKDNTGGTIELSDEGNDNVYDVGKEVTLTAKHENGYKFVRWEGTDITEDNECNNPLTIKMDKDKTITAVFEEEEPVVENYKLTVKVNNNEAGSVSISPEQPSQVYESGTEVTITAKANSGWKFDKWTGDTGGATIEEDKIIVTMDKDKTITAVFEKEEPVVENYKLTAKVNNSEAGSVSISPEQPSQGYKSGTEVTITAKANSGWKFDKWTGDTGGATVEEDKIIVIMDTDKTITAVFEKKEDTPPSRPSRPSRRPSKKSSGDNYTLTIKVDGSGTVRPFKGSKGYKKGTEVSLTVRPADGWEFDRWIGNVDSGNKVVMDERKTVTAVFVEKQIEEIEDEKIPEGTPIHEEDKEQPEEQKETVKEQEQKTEDEGKIILDEEVPVNVPKLPQTGGVPPHLFYGLGGLISTIGAYLKRKENK